MRQWLRCRNLPFRAVCHQTYSTIPYMWESFDHLPVLWRPETTDVITTDEMRKPEIMPWATLQQMVADRSA